MEQKIDFWQKIQANLAKLHRREAILNFVAWSIALIYIGAHFFELIPEKWRESIVEILALLVVLLIPTVISFSIRQLATARDAFEKEKEVLRKEVENQKAKLQNKEQTFLSQLNDWRITFERSLEILSIEGEEKITEEIRTLLKGANCVAFFGNFQTYKALLSGDSSKLIVCDRKPNEKMLSPTQYEYRYLYNNFGADLLLFQYPKNKEKSLLIFHSEGEKRAWVIDFNFAIPLGLSYTDYPLLHLPAQISAQIRSDSSHSPLLEKAAYRKFLPEDSLVDKEFSFVLRSISNGYMKPLFPPTDGTEVISRWNEQIFQNFVDYATKLIENNFDKLLITWKIDNESLQTIEHYKIFSGWIKLLNENSINVERVILIDKTDIGKSIQPPIQIEGVECKTYEDIVSNLTERVILKNVEKNSQYKYCFANMADYEFPSVCKRDFAVFLFHNRDPIIQTSELDMNDELLKLFFRLPKTEEEIKTYIGFFENCFRGTSPPSYISNDIGSALKRV